MVRAVHTHQGRIEYELVQTQRQSLEIRLDGGGGVRLFAPRRAPLRSCDAFVIERAGWIREARERLRAYAGQHAQAHPLADGAEILYEGRPVVLHVSEAAKSRAWYDGTAVWVETADPSQLREQLKRFLTEQTRARVHELVGQYAPLIGRQPGRIAIRDQRTRWGSCSSQHNLNFNYKLIMAPPEALLYVVVHELCHLYEFNHSQRFWARVRAHQGDYETWKKWLKQNGQMLGV